MIFGAPTATSPVPPVNRRTLRRTLVWAGIAGGIGAAVLIAKGQPLAALLGLVGLGLGALNARLAQVSVARYSDRNSEQGASGPGLGKVGFGLTMLGRLGVITAIALGCAILLRPAGFAVFAGLAVFQLLTIVSAMLPLAKEIRQ